MFPWLLILWIALNGRLDVEVVLVGLLISGASFAFACGAMGYSAAWDRRLFSLSPHMLLYAWTLLGEIARANRQTLPFILSGKRQPAPVLICFRTGLRTRAARTVLANSITLTPGTVTVSLEEDLFTVHCLDASMGQGIQRSALVARLARMEEVSGF